MNIEDYICKLVAENPNYTELGKKVAIHFRENFAEKINEAAKQKRIKDYGPF
jgi:hypothetical protein